MDADWKVTPLTAYIAGPAVSGTLRGVSSAAGTINLLGRGADQHVLRYWWNPSQTNWAVQDLTALT